MFSAAMDWPLYQACIDSFCFVACLLYSYTLILRLVSADITWQILYRMDVLLLSRCSAVVGWQLVHPGSCACLPLVRVQKGPQGGVSLHPVHPPMALEVQQVLPQGQELTLQGEDRARSDADAQGHVWEIVQAGAKTLAAVCMLF